MALKGTCWVVVVGAGLDLALPDGPTAGDPRALPFVLCIAPGLAGRFYGCSAVFTKTGTRLGRI